MEASRFGFNLPPAYKFDPTDADIVAHYLLPRAAGFPSPHAHAVIDADLYTCPPWELMERHGHGDTDQALFFGPPRDPDPKKRAGRSVAAGEDGVGGTWDGQKSGLTRLVLLRGNGGGGAAGEMVITYKRHHLSYYHGTDDGDGKKKKSTSGWVMYDYQIVDPQHLSGIVLSRVKITYRTKKKTNEQGKRKHHLVLPPGPDQTGPSNYYPAPGPNEAGPSNYNAPPPPVTGGEEYGGFTGGCFVGGDSNYMYDGYGGYSGQQGDGSGGGEFAAAGDFMGETTGASYVDGNDDFLNLDQDFGSYFCVDDDFCFDFGDNSGFVYPDGSNGCSEAEKQYC